MVELTKSENEIAQFILAGLSNKEIADKQSVAETTVKFHISSIYKKCDVTSRGLFISKYFNNKTFLGGSMDTLPNNTGYSAPAVNKSNAVSIVNNSVDQRDKINFIDEKFKVGKSIDQLHKMMVEVTSTEMNASNVNAACNCVSRINETINTAIQAARFLSNK